MKSLMPRSWQRKTPYLQRDNFIKRNEWVLSQEEIARIAYYLTLSERTIFCKFITLYALNIDKQKLLNHNINMLLYFGASQVLCLA